MLFSPVFPFFVCAIVYFGQRTRKVEVNAHDVDSFVFQ